MNPGGQALLQTAHDASRRQMRQVNSPNHNGDGQNVLYADGHCELQTNPFAGMTRGTPPGTFRDNIFTFGGADTGVAEGINGAIADRRDSILLPTAPEGPAPPRLADSFLPWIIAAGTVIVGVIALIVLLVWQSARTRPQGPGVAPTPSTPGAG